MKRHLFTLIFRKKSIESRTREFIIIDVHVQKEKKEKWYM